MTVHIAPDTNMTVESTNAGQKFLTKYDICTTILDQALEKIWHFMLHSVYVWDTPEQRTQTTWVDGVCKSMCADTPEHITQNTCVECVCVCRYTRTQNPEYMWSVCVCRSMCVDATEHRTPSVRLNQHAYLWSCLPPAMTIDRPVYRTHPPVQLAPPRDWDCLAADVTKTQAVFWYQNLKRLRHPKKITTITKWDTATLITVTIKRTKIAVHKQTLHYACCRRSRLASTTKHKTTLSMQKLHYACCRRSWLASTTKLHYTC
jgi:hypothetical protein